MINIESIKTQEQARQTAIEWQHKMANLSMSYVELAYWSDFFTQIGKKFGLVREFKENGIL